MAAVSTVAFDVIAALVTQCGAAVPSGVLVLNGYGNTEHAGDFVLIGAADPFTDGAAVAVETDAEFAYVGAVDAAERGHINCVAYVVNGDGDSLAAQTRLKAVLDAVAGVTRANYSLGVAELLWSQFALTQVDHDLDHGRGAWAVANFHIRYRAQF